MTAPDDSMAVKRCTRCDEFKPLAELIRNSRSKDGYGSRCKSCHNAWNRDIAARDPEATRKYGREKMSRYYKADPAKYNERHREWYQANQSHSVAYAAEWAKANPDKIRENRRRYARRHSATIVARVARWQKANPERMRDHRAVSKAKRRGAGETRRFDRASIWARDGGRCHICKHLCDPASWDLDHLIPLSLGGPHTPANVAVSHPVCNRRRHNTGPAQLRLDGVS